MENEIRRSGANRRVNSKNVPVERRKNPERRGVIKDADKIIGFMKKIPIFSGLNDDEYVKILSVCSKKFFPADHFLCEEGNESNALFILLKGRLKVTFRGGTLLTYVSPLGLIGEMGVFTNTPRSASVMATNNCTVIRICKDELFKLFSNDSALSNKILINVIKDLTEKLQEDNEVIEDLRNKKRTRIL